MDLVAEAPQLLYSVPSLGFDESKGPPTLVFITHQLIVDALPYSFTDQSGFFISNGWLGRPGRYHQAIDLLTPSGHPLVSSGPRLIAIVEEGFPYLAVTHFTGVTFSTEGCHTVVVSIEGRHRTSYPLHVMTA